MLAVVMPCNALDMSGNGSFMPNDTTITAVNDKQISDTINKVVSAADSVSMKMLSANDSVKNKNTDYCCNGDDPASITSTFLLVVTYFASDRYIFCRSYDTKSKYTIGKLKPRSRKMETDGTKILRSV